MEGKEDNLTAHMAFSDATDYCQDHEDSDKSSEFVIDTNSEPEPLDGEGSPQEEKETFPCSVCKKGFSTKKAMKNHMAMFHSRDESYPCDICHKEFSSKAAAKRHMSVHTGYKPYSCDFCLRRFSRKWNLKQHMEKQICQDKLPSNCYLDNYEMKKEKPFFTKSNKVHYAKSNSVATRYDDENPQSEFSCDESKTGYTEQDQNGYRQEVDDESTVMSNLQDTDIDDSVFGDDFGTNSTNENDFKDENNDTDDTDQDSQFCEDVSSRRKIKTKSKQGPSTTKKRDRTNYTNKNDDFKDENSKTDDTDQDSQFSEDLTRRKKIKTEVKEIPKKTKRKKSKKDKKRKSKKTRKEKKERKSADGKNKEKDRKSKDGKPANEKNKTKDGGERKDSKPANEKNKTKDVGERKESKPADENSPEPPKKQDGYECALM